MDFAHYNSVTENQPASPRLAQSTGYIFLTLNSGSVHNEGMELSVQCKSPIRNTDFRWDLTAESSRATAAHG
ncbi:MAG: hypothetical protein MZV63_21525 [Marinilabiliales bacterium]|nr:hypothetical protein [Marinilabiliales bacterium]